MSDYRTVDRDKFCQSYTSLFHTKGVCKAGVNVRELVGGQASGWLMRSPCLNENKCETPCSKFSARTPEDIAKQKAEREAIFNEMIALTPLIQSLKNASKKGGPTEGIAECPRCKGALQWTISAYNKHMHMRCKTENCIVMME